MRQDKDFMEYKTQEEKYDVLKSFRFVLVLQWEIGTSLPSAGNIVQLNPWDRILENVYNVLDQIYINQSIVSNSQTKKVSQVLNTYRL